MCQAISCTAVGLATCPLGMLPQKQCRFAVFFPGVRLQLCNTNCLTLLFHAVINDMAWQRLRAAVSNATFYNMLPGTLGNETCADPNHLSDVCQQTWINKMQNVLYIHHQFWWSEDGMRIKCYGILINVCMGNHNKSSDMCSSSLQFLFIHHYGC